MAERYRWNTLTRFGGIIDTVTDESITFGGACDLLNELTNEKEALITECKHQQGQKQRLVNYLKDIGESETVINLIMNGDIK